MSGCTYEEARVHFQSCPSPPFGLDGVVAPSFAAGFGGKVHQQTRRGRANRVYQHTVRNGIRKDGGRNSHQRQEVGCHPQDALKGGNFPRARVCDPGVPKITGRRTTPPCCTPSSCCSIKWRPPSRQPPEAPLPRSSWFAWATRRLQRSTPASWTPGTCSRSLSLSQCFFGVMA